MLCLLVTAVIPSSPFRVTLIMEAICSSETSDLTRATWCNISEDGILQSLPWKPQILQCKQCLTNYLNVEQHSPLGGSNLHSFKQAAWMSHLKPHLLPAHNLHFLSNCQISGSSLNIFQFTLLFLSSKMPSS
jgi:hypothetical protein